MLQKWGGDFSGLPWSGGEIRSYFSTPRNEHMNTPRTVWCFYNTASQPKGQRWVVRDVRRQTYRQVGLSSCTKNLQVPWKQNWLWASGQLLKWDLTAAATGGPKQKRMDNKEKKLISLESILYNRCHPWIGLHWGYFCYSVWIFNAHGMPM